MVYVMALFTLLRCKHLNHFCEAFLPGPFFFAAVTQSKYSFWGDGDRLVKWALRPASVRVSRIQSFIVLCWPNSNRLWTIRTRRIGFVLTNTTRRRDTDMSTHIGSSTVCRNTLPNNAALSRVHNVQLSREAKHRLKVVTYYLQ